MSEELNPDGDFALKTRKKVQPPSMYRVIMHNDDYTTMEFVIMVLQSVFRKNEEEAYNIMLDVHRKGAGMCGLFTRQTAETKIHTVHSKARKAGYPLRCSMEKDS